MIGRFRLRTVVIPILSLALIVSPIPGLSKLIKAAEQDAPVSLPKTVPPKKDVSFSTPLTSPQELEQFRTSTSQRLLNPDGSLTEKIYNTRIHYKDAATGKWQPIDSTLIQAADGTFRNKANRFTISLQPAANAGFFSISEDGASISFKPVFAAGAKGGIEGNKIDYKNATNDTDITYQVEPNGLKETLVLKSANAPATFSFQLRLQNLTYQTQKDGTVAFYKTGEKEPIFTLAKPFMEDANLQRTTAVSYQFRQDAAGNAILDLIADSTWLHDPNRAYPIKLDPTIQIKDPGDRDATITSWAPNTNYYGSSTTTVGQVSTGVDRTLHWFLLPSLPSGSVITSANLAVTNSVISNTAQSPVVEAHRITSNWSADTVTWNNRPTASGVEGQPGTWESTRYRFQYHDSI